MKTQHAIQQGQTLSVSIRRLGINGEGIGYFKKTIVFVPGALPKEEVSVTIDMVSEKYVQGKLKKIIKASPHRVVAPCPVYEECGGCQLQHLAYPQQLDFKRDLMKQALYKYKPKGYETYPLRPTLGMENPWHYRNKLQYQIRQTNSGNVKAGLYKKDSHELVPIDNCLVQDQATTLVINTVVDLIQKYNIPIYNEEKNSGIIKTMMVRIGQATGEIQVVFITQSPKLPQKNKIITEINEMLPQVVSIMQNIQSKKTSLVMGDDTLHLWGKDSIEEHLDEVIFDLSPRAFFQLNPQQTEVLYGEARKALAATSNDTVVDAYCGVGTIGLSLAKQVKEVRGMDTIPSAIEDAQQNATRLGISNAHYEVGTAEDLLPKWLKKGFRPDGIIVDPPRTGLDRKLIQAIMRQPVKKLVYVSCNPSTLARDLVELSKKYQIDYLQSVDMFPQTARGEVVAKLSLR